MLVITWVAPNRQTINVCQQCQERFKESGEWPRNWRGEEFCQVSHGWHQGLCDTCDTHQDEDEDEEAAH